MAHATLSASASARWLACAGTLAMCQGLPDSSGDSARWGTAAHELAAKCLETGNDAEFYRGALKHVEGDQYKVDSRMIDMVQVYLDIVRGLVDATGGALFIEHRVDYSDTLGVPDSFGTADAIIVCEDEIIVIDLKTGQSAVTAEENTQLKLYALGALEEFGLAYDFNAARLIIVQPPKSERPSEWVTDVDALVEFGKQAAVAGRQAVNLIGKSVDEIMDCLTPGEHCSKYYCRARATCPKLRADVAQTVFNSQPASPDDFANLESPEPVHAGDLEWIAASLSHVDMIEDWCKAVREEAYKRVLAGEQVPGFKLVQGRAGARAWADPEAAEQMLKGMRLKVEEMFDLKLISPTTAEKLHKAGKIGPRQWPKVEAAITRADGKPVLAPESDRRPALEIKPVADGFDALDGADDLV